MIDEEEMRRILQEHLRRFTEIFGEEFPQLKDIYSEMSDDGYVDSKYPLTGQTPDPAEWVSDEEALLYMWRFSQLWDAGYDSEVAELLAESGYDLHKMCDAKLAGITDQLALETFT